MCICMYIYTYIHTSISLSFTHTINYTTLHPPFPPSRIHTHENRGGGGWEASHAFSEALQEEVKRRLPLWEHHLLPRLSIGK